MTTAYPSGIDNFTNPTATQKQNSPSHSAQHGNVNDAIEAVEATLGTTAGTSVISGVAAGDFVASRSGTETIYNKHIVFDSRNHSIGTPAVLMRANGLGTEATGKGAMIEYQQYFEAGTYPYSSLCNNYGTTFTIGTTGYYPVAWLACHYDSPSFTGEDLHQHLNFETVKADMETIVTRISVSWGEDTAMIKFPSCTLLQADDNPFWFGSGKDASIMYISTTDTFQIRGGTAAGSRLKFITTSNGTKGTIQFGNGANYAVYDEVNSRFGVGMGTSGTPSARLHARGTSDVAIFKVESTASGTPSTAMSVWEAGDPAVKAIQIGLPGDTTKRFNIQTGGTVEWGSGTAARDTNLYRGTANQLKTDDTFNASAFQVGTANGADATVAFPDNNGLTHTLIFTKGLLTSYGTS